MHRVGVPTSKNLLARQRHEVILEAIRQDGSVRVRDLASRLEVSDMTVRRDLEALASQNLIDKVHGGATRAGGHSTNEPGFEVKQRRQQREKEAIATAAAAMVRPGSAVGLTAGTTTWTLAKLLHRVPDLTIVTNAPSIARVFYRMSRPDLNVVITGGMRTPSDALVGPLATQALRNLHVDLVFMGVHGMDSGLGFSTPNLPEAEVNRAFVDAAREVVVLADHTKWGIRGLARIAGLDAAGLVISDDRLARSAREDFAAAGTAVELVEVD